MKSICFAVLILSFFVSSIYSVPPVINYAGQVAVDGEAFDGNGLFKFAIINDSGSTTYWSNDSTSEAGSEPSASVSVSVNGGLYSVLLGNSAIQGMNAIDSSVFQDHTDAKLRVWFNDGTNGFQQLTPDRSFASVPYALSAGSAGSADIAPGSINGSMLAPSLLSDLNSSITDGSISKAKMDPNLVRYFIPEISTNPAGVSIIQGTGITLSVQATGKFLSYQWQKNGANLAGQTNPSLVLSNTNASTDDANYSVIISNDWGSVTSPLARVAVATALPTITILGSATLVHEAATSYTDAGATAVDALGGDLTSSISITSADINVTDVGNQVLTYSVADAGGNTNTATRMVTVQDTTDPVITLNQGTSYTHNLNTAWVDPGYDANDTLDGNLTASVSIYGTVDVNTTGTYILNYSVSDTAGNQVDINRTVNVQNTLFYRLVGQPIYSSVFNSIDFTYFFPNSLSNVIWDGKSNRIYSGHYSNSGYWSIPAGTGNYTNNPDNLPGGSFTRMVSIPENEIVIYNKAGSYSPISTDDIYLSEINATGSLNEIGQAIFSDNLSTNVLLSSSSPNEYIILASNSIRHYSTQKGSRNLTFVKTVTLQSNLTGNFSSHCYGGTFAWDGMYYYFPGGPNGISSRNYDVYDQDGVKVGTFTANGSGAINSLYFDWSVGRYSTHDGFGNRSGGLSYSWSGGTGDDSHCFSPVSNVHTR